MSIALNEIGAMITKHLPQLRMELKVLYNALLFNIHDLHFTTHYLLFTTRNIDFTTHKLLFVINNLHLDKCNIIFDNYSLKFTIFILFSKTIS